MIVIHVITGLGLGGAEQMLCKLLEYRFSNVIDSYVVSLTNDIPLGNRLREAQIPVDCLGMEPGRITAAGLTKLFRILKSSNPSVVQTWLYHSDLLGGIIAKLAGVPHVIWNIRNTNLDADKIRWQTRQTVSLCSLLSNHLPSKIICNSRISAREHQNRGYSAVPFRIIPNGFDVELFKPQQDIKLHLRKKLSLPIHGTLVGHVARFDPVKNHKGLLRAFAHIVRENNSVYLLCCGPGVTAENRILTEQMKELGISHRVFLLGPREDTVDLMNVMDLMVLPSHGEAFPNVVGEAMACEVPCMVTDVGDCAEIVGKTGWIVQPGDEEALVESLLYAIGSSKEHRQEKGRAARQRITENYRIQDIVQQYEDLYLSLAN